MRTLGVFLLLLSQASLAVVHGTPATDRAYAAVGTLRAFDSDTGDCTATLIAPEWIVTAEHCLYGGPEDDPFKYEASQLSFQIGPKNKKPQISVKLTQLITPPEINGTVSDVLFAKLERPITGVTPIQLSLKPLSVGSDYEIVGFGETSSQGFGGKSGSRLKGQYRIISVGGNGLMTLFKSKSKFRTYLNSAHPGEAEVLDALVHKSELLPGHQVHAWDPRGRENGVLTAIPRGGWSTSCHGDSGGPMLQKTAKGFVVVGVISSGFNGNVLGCLELGSLVSIPGPAFKEIIKSNRIPHL